MSVKPWAGFIADFPDDQVWGGGGQMEICGGQNVAVALGEILTPLGCEVSAPEYAGVKGWEFDLYYERRHRFWCQVTSFHPAFYLLFEDPAITGRTRAKNAAAYAELWRRLADALDKDPRFHDVEWRSWEDGPPDFDEIGSAKARENASAIASDPLDQSFRPEPTARRGSGLGCLLMIGAACVCLVGAVSTVRAAIDLIVWGGPDAVIDLLVSVTFFCLSAFGFWALMRRTSRPRKA